MSEKENVSKVDKISNKIDEKLKIKNIFASYLLAATIFIGGYVFTTNPDITDPRTYFLLIYIWITIIVSVIVYLKAGPSEFLQENIKDWVRHEKTLRDPKTIEDIIESEFNKLDATLKMNKQFDNVKTETIKKIGEFAEENDRVKDLTSKTTSSIMSELRKAEEENERLTSQ